MQSAQQKVLFWIIFIFKGLMCYMKWVYCSRINKQLRILQTLLLLNSSVGLNEINQLY